MACWACYVFDAQFQILCWNTFITCGAVSTYWLDSFLDVTDFEIVIVRCKVFNNFAWLWARVRSLFAELSWSVCSAQCLFSTLASAVIFPGFGFIDPMDCTQNLFWPFRGKSWSVDFSFACFDVFFSINFFFLGRVSSPCRFVFRVLFSNKFAFSLKLVNVKTFQLEHWRSCD